MSTKNRFNRKEINPQSKYFTQTRSIIETTFYSNNVRNVVSLEEAYNLAKASPGTVVTDMPIYKAQEIGLAKDAKVLVYNDGPVHGRCAAARRILGQSNLDENEIHSILKEAVYQIQKKDTYQAESLIGLDEDFMVRAKLLIPKGYENIIYNWLLNFQVFTEEYIKMYNCSKEYNEGDIFIISDPDWRHPDYPYGLAFFDPDNNCAAILGMRYFGEYKKGTLTLAWNIANRNGYVSCHGGLKRYNMDNGDRYVMGFFGLSGSGKSTLTHAKHSDKYDVSILHDDAFIISTEQGNSVALEPSYFDKTADYPLESEDNKYLLSVQNCGITMDSEGNKVVVSEDIRNKNGRAIKSKLWSPNRVDKFEEKVNAIVWLMKDPTLPPVLKITDPVLASAMGALLATKRTSAERLAKGVDAEQLVIEPYANPFRTYPLVEDYMKFKKLFTDLKTDCYIFNTGFFLDKKVTKEITLETLESIVENRSEFIKWHPFKDIEIMKIDGFVPDMNDKNYVEKLINSLNERVHHIELKNKDSYVDALPEEALNVIKKVAQQINT